MLLSVLISIECKQPNIKEEDDEKKQQQQHRTYTWHTLFWANITFSGICFACMRLCVVRRSYFFFFLNYCCCCYQLSNVVYFCAWFLLRRFSLSLFFPRRMNGIKYTWILWSGLWAHIIFFFLEHNQYYAIGRYTAYSVFSPYHIYTCITKIVHYAKQTPEPPAQSILPIDVFVTFTQTVIA